MSSKWSFACAHSNHDQISEPADHSNNTTAEFYRLYKVNERVAFSQLFPDEEYQDWTIRELHRRAIEASHTLTTKKRIRVKVCLSKAVELRQTVSTRYKDAPVESRVQHHGFLSLIQSIITLLEAVPGRIRNEKNADEPKRVDRMVNQYQVLECEDGDNPEDSECSEKSDKHERPDDSGHEAVSIEADVAAEASIREISYLQFLEDIQKRIAQAEDGISRAEAGRISFATAAMILTTLLREIKTIVSVETLLNPSWFKSSDLERLVKVPLQLEHISAGYSYWQELQDCVNNIFMDVEDMSKPYLEFEYGIQEPMAPVWHLAKEQLLPALTQSQTKKKQSHYSISELPITGIIAVSLRRRIERRFRKDNTLTNRLAFLVKTRIAHCENMFDVLVKMQLPRCLHEYCAVQRSCVSANKRLSERAQDDILLLIHMASLVEFACAVLSKLVLEFSAEISLFAYMCKYAEFKGTPLPEVLGEALHNDRFSHGFLGQGIPRSEYACIKAINRLIPIFRFCDRQEFIPPPGLPTCRTGWNFCPPLMENILYCGGRYTVPLARILATATLEEILEREQRIPAMLMKTCLRNAITTWANKPSAENGLKSINLPHQSPNLALTFLAKQDPVTLHDCTKFLMGEFIAQWDAKMSDTRS